MEPIRLEPRAGLSNPYTCLVCGKSIRLGSLRAHLRNIHSMHVAEYRLRFNIPDQSHNRDLVMAKEWAGRKGVSPPNKIYAPSDVVVTCACGKHGQLNPAY